MPHLRELLLGCVGLLTATVQLRADAVEDTKKQLVGKWEVTRKSGGREVKGEMAFTTNGKVSMKVQGPKGEVTFAGTYKLLDESTIEVTFTVRDTPMTDKSKLKITGDVLELTGEDGKVQRLTRIK
jgi:uncharacterized protein (TIGR03066 family)